MQPIPVRHVPPQGADQPPTLLVVVDTEEEFDWNAPFDRNSTSTANIACQPLAQALFDAHGIVPTYAVDYPVATAPAALAVLKPWADAGRCEIGAHLHPWVNPPDEEAVTARHSFASNLPAELMRRKLQALRDAIAAGFGRAPLVYKAGRYGIGPATPGILAALGFAADTSVVPHSDFTPIGGPDFRAMPGRPFLSSDGIAEVPLSVHFAGRAAGFGPALFPWLERLRALRLPGIAARLGLIERLRLSPEAHGFDDMRRQTEAALAQGERTLVLTYHSSSLMTGGSPYASTQAGRDGLVRTLERYLGYFMALPRATSSTVRAVAASLQQ